MPRRRVRSFVQDTDRTEVCRLRLRLLAKRVPMQGHTSASGNPKINQKIIEARAFRTSVSSLVPCLSGRKSLEEKEDKSAKDTAQPPIRETTHISPSKVLRIRKLDGSEILWSRTAVDERPHDPIYSELGGGGGEGVFRFLR